MTVPRPLGTSHWEALKGYMPYSQHRPRNRSDKVRRRGIRGESDQLRSSREPVVGSDCGPWACVLPSVAGPPRADSHSLLPSTWGRLQPPRFTPNHPQSRSGQLWPTDCGQKWHESLPDQSTLPPLLYQSWTHVLWRHHKMEKPGRLGHHIEGSCPGEVPEAPGNCRSEK